MTWLKELLSKLFKINGIVGEWKTTGPDPAEYPLPTVGDIVHVAEKVNNGEFKEGRWSLAAYKEMHSGRIGRAIVPRTLVVHTTDMRPGTFAALVRNWTSQLGRGNGAHFLIGKSAADGVVQFAPVHRNANHAGGPNCGAIGGMHPNTVSVGVEIDNAGGLKKDAAGWYHADGAVKTRIPAADVFVDEKGRGWEKVTPYQLEMLAKLWTALRPTLKSYSTGAKLSPNGDYAKNGVAHYAGPKSLALIGHVSINPVNKRDPGPQVMAEINKWA